VITAIVVVLILLGIGIVADALFRLRDWLNRPPPSGDDRQPPDAKP
jgi:hypothetical protein